VGDTEMVGVAERVGDGELVVEGEGEGDWHASWAEADWEPSWPQKMARVDAMAMSKSLVLGEACASATGSKAVKLKATERLVGCSNTQLLSQLKL
jgi:hypothetical protein